MKWLDVVVRRLISTIQLLIIPALALFVAYFAGYGDKTFRSVAGQSIALNLWVLLMLATLTATALYYYVTFTRAETRLLKNQIDDQLAELQRLRGEAKVDVATGIPNKSKFDDDVVFVNKLASVDLVIQVVIIDLVNFKKVNQDFGQIKANEIIRFLARNIYKAMRRDEEAYRRQIEEQNLYDFISGSYRTYMGGDEFIFLLRGSQDDALGFLNRLDDKFKNEFSGGIGEIVDKRLNLRFWAGVASLKPDEAPSSALAHVDALLRAAKDPNSTHRVKWEDLTINRRSPIDLMVGGRIEGVEDKERGFNYGRARQRFAISDRAALIDIYRKEEAPAARI